MENSTYQLRSLTPRERQIMALVAEGHSSKFISRQLSISPRTVEMHRAHAMRKVGAKNLVALVRISVADPENGFHGDCSIWTILLFDSTR